VTPKPTGRSPDGGTLGRLFRGTVSRIQIAHDDSARGGDRPGVEGQDKSAQLGAPAVAGLARSGVCAGNFDPVTASKGGCDLDGIGAIRHFENDDLLGGSWRGPYQALEGNLSPGTDASAVARDDRTHVATSAGGRRRRWRARQHVGLG